MITVNGLNSKPVVQGVDVFVLEDGAAVTESFAGDDVDTDDSTASLTFNVGTLSEGILTNNLDGTFTFDPGSEFQRLSAGQTETITVGYNAVDRHSLASDPANITIVVEGRNDAPTAVNDENVSANEGQVRTIDVLANDIEPDSLDAKSVFAVDGTSVRGATVSISGNFVRYDPTTSATINGLAAGQVATDTFAYTIRDASGAQSSAIVTVTVSGVNDAPEAVDDQYAVDADRLLTINPSGVLGNDTDADPGTTIELFNMSTSSASGAVVTSDGLGGFTYDPTGIASFLALDTGESATDTFLYIATDQTANSNVGTVTITVRGVDDAPIAVDDDGPYQAVEDVTFTVVGSFGVLANDSDPEGDPLTASLVTQATHGRVDVGNNGSFSYVPTTPDFTGLDSFVYSVTDGQGTSEATATIFVQPRNDAPVAVDDSYTIANSETLTTNVLSNDTDVDSPATSFTALLQPANPSVNGVLTLDSDGALTYTPDAGFSGEVTFTYEVTDDQQATSNLATVRITVEAGNGWHNAALPQDVTGDGLVVALDALIVINDLNENDTRTLPLAPGGNPFLDVNDDGAASPIDALQVINYLNNPPVALAEGESLLGNAAQPQHPSVDMASLGSFYLEARDGRLRSLESSPVVGAPSASIRRQVGEPIEIVSNIEDEVVTALSDARVAIVSTESIDEALDSLFGDSVFGDSLFGDE
jgi:VCBS repeat-containing protein